MHMTPLVQRAGCGPPQAPPPCPLPPGHYTLPYGLCSPVRPSPPVRYDIDYILVDLDASRGRGNGHIICCCDGLIMP